MGEIKDLRKTNFSMGGNSNKDDLSVYYRDYRPWEIPQYDSVAQNYKFQKTNLDMGDKNGPHASRRWATTQAKDFIDHGPQPTVQLNEEKKADLRNHHFGFGNTSD